ncbi:MAG: hypothetical protein RL020_740 [Pseudomonadota bacterium]|jgi:tetratricopeptide (TPR) repeat protein
MKMTSKLFFLSNMRQLQTLLFIALACSLVACGSKASREAHYMGLAMAHLEKNQPDQAIAQLNNVLQINTANYEAFYHLGLIYESRQQYRNAIENYTRALEQKPDFTLAKTHLARMHLMPGQAPKSVEKATAILKSAPTDLSAKAVMAEVTARTGNVSKAISDLESARKNNIQSLDVYKQLASLYLLQGNLPKAENLLVEALKRYPESVSLHTSLAQTYALGENPANAEASLQAIIKLEPNDFSHQAKLASHYVIIGQLQKAESLLRNNIAQPANDIKPILALKEFLLRYRSPELAEAELLANIQAAPKIYDLRFALAELYEQTGSLEKAERIYQDIIQLNFSEAASEKTHTRLASMYVSMGKLSAAKTQAEAALILSRNSQDALVIRGKLALEEGDWERAIADFRTALKQQPKSLEYVGLLARAHMQNKQPGLGRELLFQAAKNNSQNLPIRLMLAEYLLQMRDFKAAQEEANSLIKEFPFDLPARRLRQHILAAQNPVADAEKMAAANEVALPPNVAALYRHANQYLEQKRYEEAAGEFQKALRLVPSAIEPLNGLVEAYLAQGRADLALARVKTQLHINSPTLHQAYYLLGQIHTGQNHSAEAERAYRRALDINSSWDAPYLALAKHYHAQGDTKQAQMILETAIRNIPQNQTIVLYLASLFEANQSYDRAIALYEALLKTNPDMDVAINNLAVILLDKRSDKASFEKALNLARRFQNATHSAYLDTLGWALFKNGLASRGIIYLEKALTAEPEFPMYHYHAGMAYKTIGDKDRAKTHLLKAIASGMPFSGRDQAKALVATL